VKKVFLLGLMALAGCATSTAAISYDTELAVDAANTSAATYLGLPLCSTGGPTLCRSASVVPKLVAAVAALNADWAAYTAPTPTTTLAAVTADIAAVNAVTGVSK
jgi:hypothetical protein